MRKSLFLVIPALLLLSGCATYSFQKGQSPYNKGYVAARYGRVIPEYTLGKDNSVPDEQIAKERFRRRRAEVESYYKQMGYIENRFKQMFIDPPAFMIQSIIGLFRMPAIAIADYKYNRNPQYKEETDKREDVEYKTEKERIKDLKEKLNKYIQEDLQKETPVLKQALDAIEEKAKVAPEIKDLVVQQSLDQEQKIIKETQVIQEPAVAQKPQVAQEPKIVQEPQVVKEAPLLSKPEKEPVVSIATKPQVSYKSPTAIIIAKPLKGPSPLTVKFYASKSSSPNGRIISYSWDFGDGDTSTKQNPTNIYWSTTYGSRMFNVTLTVKDDKGATASSNSTIEVLTR